MWWINHWRTLRLDRYAGELNLNLKAHVRRFDKFSAAHCTDRATTSSLSIRAGTTTKNTGGVVLQVKTIHQHEKYNSQTIDFDFSIVELAESFRLSNLISPIHLIEESVEVEDGKMCTVSGWGNTQNPSENSRNLRAVDVPKVSQEECNVAYGSITERMICAGYEKGGRDACQVRINKALRDFEFTVSSY